jgi:hypothetical protein
LEDRGSKLEARWVSEMSVNLYKTTRTAADEGYTRFSEMETLRGEAGKTAFNKVAGWVSNELCRKQSDRGEAVQNRKKQPDKKPE